MNPSSRSSAGFTLVELMVSTAIIALIMLVLVAMTNQTNQTWRYTTEKIEKFQAARDGFESMTRRISQATLNPNWDYLDKNLKVRDKTIMSTDWLNFVPVYYGRVTDLRFVSGPIQPNATVAFPGLMPGIPMRPGHGIFFQAPFGNVTDKANYGILDNLLNTWGYYIETNYDQTTPSFINQNATNMVKRWRPRLMEYMQTAEKMQLYDPTDATYKWFTNGFTNANPAKPETVPYRVLAENILTLVILPKLSKADEDLRASKQNATAAMLSPNYIYDSTMTLNPGANGGTDPGAINPKNQLPPILSVTMVALDERSAEKLYDKYCAPSPSQNNYSNVVMGMDVASTKVSPAVAYSTLFTDAKRLEDNTATPTPGDGDLYDLERVLTHEGCTYRVFTSNVSVRGAKWSRVR